MDGCYESDWDTLWWDVIQIIITHSPEVPTDRRNVVRLRRVGQRTILVKTNALRSEGIEFRLNGRISWIGGKRKELGGVGVLQWNLPLKSLCFQAKSRVQMRTGSQWCVVSEQTPTWMKRLKALPETTSAFGRLPLLAPT